MTSRNSELNSISTQLPPSPAPPNPGAHSTRQVQQSLFQPGDCSKQPAFSKYSSDAVPPFPLPRSQTSTEDYTVQFRQARARYCPHRPSGLTVTRPQASSPPAAPRPTSHSFPALPFPELDTHCLMFLVTLCLVHLPHSLPPPPSPDSLLYILDLNFSSQYHLLREVLLVSSKAAWGLPCVSFTVEAVTSLIMTGKC